MADPTVPYMAAYGNITKALEKIKVAQVPSRFSQDFLGTKLNLTGGSARPVIPFLKRTGFLAADGTPTELYRRFRNEAQTGAAAAEALRIGYAPLYEVNEQIHTASNTQLKGVVVQVTGAEPSSSTVAAIIGSFKALKAFADFEATPEVETPEQETRPAAVESARTGAGIRLGYTINLNLPATSDIAVFDAIFKSLREQLL
jgi:hypothetical protein